jgi:hypothetical protein
MAELKITADHLKRDAYLYVRQSTLRQVAEHGESTRRQYALRDRAIASGWAAEHIRVMIVTSASLDRAQRRVTASRNSSAKWHSARPVSSWVWKSRGSPAIRPIGIVSSSCAP